MDERKVGIILNYLNILLHVGIGLLYVPILLRYIGKNEYGLYQLMGSLIGYLGVMSFGVDSALIRFYSKYRATEDSWNMENLLAMTLRLCVGITFLVLLIGCSGYFFLDEIFETSMTSAELFSAKQLYLILLFNLAINFLTMVFTSVINAEEKFLFLKGTEILQLIIQPILVILILQKYPYVISVVLIQTILNCVLILSRIYYCFFDLKISIRFHEWNFNILKSFRKLALSIFTVTLLNLAFCNGNQIILGAVSGTSAVAVYSIASLIFMNYISLANAISGVYLPHVTFMVAKHVSMKELSELFIKVGRVQYFLLLLILTGFIIFGRQFILKWAGNGFLESYWTTLILIIPFTVELIQGTGATILQALNCYEFRAKISFGFGMLNFALAIPLGNLYGGVGCATATAICVLIGNGLIMNWYYYRYVGLNVKIFWKQIGRISAIGILCCIVGLLLHKQVSVDSLVIFIMEMILYVFFYVACMWCMAMNQEEKEMIQYFWRRII